MRQRALAAQARVRQREQIERQHAEQARINEEQRRAEELRQNRKRERSASPTLDLPQKKPALERPNAEGEEAVMDLSMSTFNNLQTSAGQKGDDRATAVPDRSVSKHKNPGEFVSFPKFKPPVVPCSVQLQGMPRIGGTEAVRNGWSVLLRIDGGYRGDPSLALIFETNLKRRTNGIVSKNKNETNRCVFRWKPWSAAVHLAGSSEPDHVHDIDFFSFRGLPPHVVQDVSEEGSPIANDGMTILVFCLTNTSLGLEGTPSVPAWEQYGDVKDVICELASGRKCTLTVSVAQDRRCRDATHMLQKAYARRFQPHYTYPQEAHEPATVLDLRRMDTVMRIGNTLKHFIPSAKTWRDGSAEDTEWTPERLFDLPKHLNSLLRLGVSVIPGETPDKVMEKPVQVVEEAEEGSEEGKILG